MTLLEYINKKNTHYEFTITDADYDMECYFYNDFGSYIGEDPVQERTLWTDAMEIIASKLTVKNDNGSDWVEVNFSEVIENAIDKLEEADLFIYCDIDSIMEDLGNIISGFVSENWLMKFAKAL